MPDTRPSVAGSRAPSRRRQATRERVLDAARDVFAERGVFGGTVEDICARAGYTRGAFYSNFADKDDVLRALVAREHDRLLADLDAGFALIDVAAPTGASADPAAMLASIASRLLASIPFDRQFSLIQAELEIHAVRDPAVAKVYVDADNRFRARIAGFLDRAIRQLGRELVVDPGEAADVAFGIVERSVRRALLERSDAAAGVPDPNAFAMRMLPLVMIAMSCPIEPASAD
jgi:AcrR family transcriptional regulator